jgi:hypothetical protein
VRDIKFQTNLGEKMRYHLFIYAALLQFALAISPANAQSNKSGLDRFAETVVIGNQTLIQNGKGIRYKAVFQVYAAAMYLPSKTSSAEQAISMSGPKRVHVIMLRDVSAEEMGKLFSTSLRDNALPSELSKSIDSLVKVGGVFAKHKQLRVGDEIFVDWIPGSGTVLNIRGVVEAAYEPKEFYNMWMRVWLGQKPADTRLKDSLLSLSSVATDR